MIPRSISEALSRPALPLRPQRQTTAVMVSEIAHGSMMITRITPRPMKSSLRIMATGSEISSAPPTTETVQMRSATAIVEQLVVNTSAKLSRPVKPRSCPNRLTSCSEVQPGR
jgi:hypothetical protein